ncbi:MAG: hypothetical protein ACC628_21460, partial [Pirellulaceae bacterium]
TQLRQDADARYASDTGLTRRALSALLDRFVQESAGESEVPGIVAILAPAYRILEAGHEAVHLRACLSNLLSLERWESQDITSRLDHPRQWDVVVTNLESTARSLREARYPGDIASRVDRLRSASPSQDASRKITSRRYQRDAMIGAAHELAELTRQLDEILGEIEPVMEEARAIIARYVPTIPQMAERAARDLRALEQQTTQVADNVPDSRNAEQPIDELQEQQHQINQQLDDLVEALVEDANAQDLLTDEGRERARDADDSLAMVQEPAKQMNRAMQEAAMAERPREQAQGLSQAAEQQEKAADALDQIAEHFERLETGEDLAKTRNALRQAEREMGLARQMDQQYQRAQALGEMANQNPRELLAQLEAELQQNPTMQEALSEISQDALQQAKNSLGDAAEQEENIRRALERSDPEFREKKKEMVRELHEIAEQASNLSRNLVQQANSAANSAKAPEARQKLGEAQQNLNEAANQSRDINEDSLLEDVVERVREMAERLKEASRELAQSEPMAAAEKEKPIHDTEEKRAARQRDLEAGRKRFQDQRIRQAKDRARNRTREEQRATQQQRTAENNVRNAEKQRAKAQQNLQRNPESDSAKREVANAESKRESARDVVQRAKQATEQSKQRTQQAEAEKKRLEQMPLPPLAAPNPAADLAQRYTEEAVEVARKLTESAKELAAEPAWADELAPSPQQLTGSTARQENIGEDVSQAAEDVARASRHEQRLGKPSLPAILNEAAENIDQVAEGEVAGAEDRLAEAAEQASAEEAGGGPDNQPSLAAHGSVEVAQEAIAGEAAALDEILNPPQQVASNDAQGEPTVPEAGTAPSGASQPGPPSPAEVAEGQLLARTLDEVDRALAAAQDTGQEAAPAQGAPPPTAASLAQAAQAQSASMAHARMQAQRKPQAAREGALVAVDGSALSDPSLPDFIVLPGNRNEDEAWGKLRGKSAEDLTEGRRESVSPEYRKQVQTYFRVIAERARKKKQKEEGVR